MVVMRLATRRARHWWWASALRLVGVVSRLAVVVIKVPAMEVGGRGGCGCEGDNGASADGDGCDGDECVCWCGEDGLDDSSSADDASETTRDHAVEGANLILRLKAWEITQLRIRIWRMTSCMKQLKKVNYGIVVGLKVAKSELRRLRKAESDVQRNKSTTVVKNKLRMVKDLVTEKIGIEVSRQAEGQRLAVERLMLKTVSQLGSVDRLIGGSTVTGDM